LSIVTSSLSRAVFEILTITTSRLWYRQHAAFHT